MKKILFLAMLLGTIFLNKAKAGDHKLYGNPDTINIDSLEKFVRSYIAEIYYTQIEKGAPRTKFLEWEKEALRKYGEAGEQTIWGLHALTLYIDYNKDKRSSDFKKWVLIKAKLNKKYPAYTEVGNLNNDAWFTFANTADKVMLEIALLWSKKAISIEPTANYYDTYGNILYKLGRVSDAISALEKAITLPPGDGSLAGVKTNLEKMRKGEKTW